MPKSIVILFDGTGNEIEGHASNIMRLYGCLSRCKDQLVYYTPGVGVSREEEDVGGIVRRLYERGYGAAVGWGIDLEVKQAYQFLVENYKEYPQAKDPNARRDKIFIFGFSRGAYSARILAGFLHCFGLVGHQERHLVDFAYRAYALASTERDPVIARYRGVIRPRDAAIDGLGLFDTVASVVHWGRWGPHLMNYVSTSENPSVKEVRHAVAINERRCDFQPMLWPNDQKFVPSRSLRANIGRPPKQVTKEVWFAGAHSDIGGGYEENLSTLAKIPLNWMIEEAKAWGLLFDDAAVSAIVLGKLAGGGYVQPNSRGLVNPSNRPAWLPLELLPRRKPEWSMRPSIAGVYVPLFERRYIPPDALIHASVTERKPLPPNLPRRFATVS